MLAKILIRRHEKINPKLEKLTKVIGLNQAEGPSHKECQITSAINKKKIAYPVSGHFAGDVQGLWNG